MRKQTVICTALPNGIEGNMLRLSVLVSPRLQTDELLTGNATPILKQFPDFLLWASKKLTVTVHFEKGPSVTVEPQPKSPAFALDPALWAALFKDTTLVRPFKFDKFDDKVVHSYPTKHVLSFLKAQYQKIATESPTQFPSVQSLADDKTAFGQIAYDWELAGNPPGRVARPAQRELSLAGQIDQTIRKVKAMPPAPAPHPALDFMQVKLFHRPLNAAVPMTPARALMLNKAKKPRTVEHVRVEPKVPKFDFHQAVSALGEYPCLMRRLGLIVDLKVPASGVPPASRVSVTVTWPPAAVPDGVTRVNFSPKTAYTRAGGTFLPAPKGPEILNGFLQLRDPQKPADQQPYDLVQVDLDGAALKAMNFASNLLRSLSPKYKTIDTPEAMSVPSLRSGGISLARTGRAPKLVATFDMANKNNGVLQGYADNPVGAQPDVPLFAEDVSRGYRIDVRDGSGQWRSLCRRVGTYRVRGLSTAPVPPDEGVVTLAVTSSADKSSPDLYLHESLLRWAGWSLCARRPGLHLSEKDTLDTTQEFTNESGTEFGVSATFAAEPHSLPRLRFGTPYQLRARVVDLAGNSLSLDEADKLMTPPVSSRVTTDDTFTYGRFEPISSPVVVLRKSVETSAGESLERLVIRSRNVTPADDAKPSPDVAERHIAPPLSSQLLAEAHGRFDAGTGMNKAAYAAIKSREKMLEPDPPVPRVTFKEVIHPEGQLVLPYLPDWLSRGATFVNLPGAPLNAEGLRVMKVDFGGPDEWPASRPFRISVVEESSTPQLWNASARVLTVRVPKAEVVRVRLSSYLSEDDLKSMGIWQWIQEKKPQSFPALLQAAKEGRHWMITPYRELVLVHAVQQPLITPQLNAKTFASTRNYGNTFARISDQLAISGKSTSKVDLKAEWDEPIDVVSQPKPGTVSRKAHAFEVPVTPTATDLRINGRHDFGDTKYRRVTYEAVATTRFREYFVSAADSTTVLTRTSAKRPIDILSSARPAAPAVLYVVPTFAWTRDATGSGVKSTRGGGGLRVYLERPWFSSGDGELLGVVLRGGAPLLRGSAARLRLTAQTDGDDDPLKPYVTQWGADPIWSANVAGSAPALDDFKTAPAGAKESGLTLDEIPSARVTVAGHTVQYDDTRQLWYCDIELDPGNAYYPFVRLALARYQPKSLQRDGTDVKLSRVVLADFAQLAPDRSVSITFSADRKVLTVAVFGIEPGETGVSVGLRTDPVQAPIKPSVILPGRAPVTPSVQGTLVPRPAATPPKRDGRNEVEVSVERRPTADENELSWAPEPDAKVVADAKPGQARLQTLWSGSVTLPPSANMMKHRLVIKEYEIFYADAPGAFLGKRIERRLVYADALPL